MKSLEGSKILSTNSLTKSFSSIASFIRLIAVLSSSSSCWLVGDFIRTVFWGIGLSSSWTLRAKAGPMFFLRVDVSGSWVSVEYCGPI